MSCKYISIEDNLHERPKAVFWKNKKNISKCHLLKFLPRVLSVKNSLKDNGLTFHGSGGKSS